MCVALPFVLVAASGAFVASGLVETLLTAVRERRLEAVVPELLSVETDDEAPSEDATAAEAKS